MVDEFLSHLVHAQSSIESEVPCLVIEVRDKINLGTMKESFSHSSMGEDDAVHTNANFCTRR